MKKYFIITLNLLFFAVLFTGCSTTETKNLYQVPVVIAAPISDAAPLCGSIKGTMLAGKTYTIGCDVIINEKDTVIVQEGVKINFISQVNKTKYSVRALFSLVITKILQIKLSKIKL